MATKTVNPDPPTHIETSRTSEQKQWSGGYIEQEMRTTHRKLALEMADEARFNAYSHKLSAKWWQRLDMAVRGLSLLFGITGSITGVKSITLVTSNNHADSKIADTKTSGNLPMAVTTATNIAQFVVTLVEGSHYSPRKISEEHRMAGVKWQDLFTRLDYYHRIKLNDASVPVSKLKEEFVSLSHIRANIEEQSILVEDWTIAKAQFQTKISDQRRNQIQKKVAAATRRRNINLKKRNQIQ